MTYFIASSSSLPDSHALRRTTSQEIDSSTPEILTSPVLELVQTSFLLVRPGLTRQDGRRSPIADHPTDQLWWYESSTVIREGSRSGNGTQRAERVTDPVLQDPDQRRNLTARSRTAPASRPGARTACAGRSASGWTPMIAVFHCCTKINRA